MSDFALLMTALVTGFMVGGALALAKAALASHS